MRGARAGPTTMTRVTWLATWLFGAVVLAYLALFTVTSLTRLRQFSPDSMNYVEVGRNIAAGRGIVQPALGFNESHHLFSAPIPAPLTAQPAGYPLLIALLARLGMPAPDAALLLASLSYGVVLLTAYLLGRLMYAESCVGLLAVVALLSFDPLRYVAAYAWSEAPGIAWMLLSFCCVAGLSQTRRAGVALALAAGLLAGSAFATRYAFLPLLPLTLAALLAVPPLRQGLRQANLYLVGWSVPAAATIGHNWLVSGTLLGDRRNPSDLGLLDNARAMVDAALGNSLGPVASSEVQELVLGGVVVLCLGILALRRRLSAAGRALFVGHRRSLLPLWALVYLAVLVYQRTHTYFDAIDERLVAPGAVTLVFLVAALVVQALGLRLRTAIYPALALAALAVYHQAQILATTLVVDMAAVVAQSERLTWVSTHTTADLIIGDDTMDIPFYLHRTLVGSFSAYPYNDRPTYLMIMAFVHRQCAHYRRVYLVLRRNYATEQDWNAAYGPFIADIVHGATQRYPPVRALKVLQDGSVFTLACR